MSALGDSVTWADWVRLVAAEHGIHGLDDDLVGWLLWEGTAWPMTTDVAYLRPQLVQVLTGGPAPCPCCGRDMTTEHAGVCGRCAARMGWIPTGCPDRW